MPKEYPTFKNYIVVRIGLVTEYWTGTTWGKKEEAVKLRSSEARELVEKLSTEPGKYSIEYIP